MNRPSKKNDQLTQQDIRRYNGYIWKFVATCFVIVVLLILSTSLGLFGPLPSLRELENPKSSQASSILAADNSIIGKYYEGENRTIVPYSKISPNVVNALVATEDNHFYDHSGIDFWRSFSIIAYNLVGSRQGGSTITQQLARNLFSDEERAKGFFARGFQKLKELIIAVRLEKHYTKQEIITMYLNTVDYGSHSNGVSAAASTFFNTTPDKLTPDQAALLVAVVNAPSYYAPVRHQERALSRRNFVLARMADEKFLSDNEVKELQQKPLGIDYHPVSHTEGLAPYFREELRKTVKSILASGNFVKSDGTPYDLNHDGLKIYTTIDATMQQYAEDAQREWMRKLQHQFNMEWKGVKLSAKVNNYDLRIKQGMRESERYRQLKTDGLTDEDIVKNFYTPDQLNIFTWKGSLDTLMKPIDSVAYAQMLLRNSLMSMDPTTGYVKAWVGGINFEHYKSDQVKVGARQVGSTAKPFTYATAIKNGYSPCMSLPNTPITITSPGAPDWTPRSAGKPIPGPLTLKSALAFSQNWVTARLMNEVTPQPVAEMIKSLGIKEPVPEVPSICLGVFDATVMEMTAAYSAFVNHGVWTEPTYLLRIEDKNGTPIYTNTPKVKQVMDEEVAYKMVDMLQGVVDIKGGTGNRVRWMFDLTGPIGGKTGTTNDNSDGWFIGVTPKLVTGIWTGCEKRDFHFRSLNNGEGANSALPIFGLYMQKVYANQALGIQKGIVFDPPKNPLTSPLDCSAYNQEVQGTGEVEKKLGF
ncbi:penicillin-binding protein 1A [Mucilaginibacter calamicampi]|uniref:Penicillin-binding protein 1A n=1 Tax=Mucilaginibacter calamicampi TaxID=1302352 RepID=A0ABW2YT89_9SPHI